MSEDNKEAEVKNDNSGKEARLNEKLYTDQKLQEAKALIARHLSDALPQEPTQVFLQYMYEKTGGEYNGKIRGIHYIRLEIATGYVPGAEFLRENHITPAQDEINLLIVAHELLHQRNAEAAGQEYFFGCNLDDLVSDKDVEQLPPVRLFNKVSQERLRKRIIPTTDNLFRALDEGIATSGESFLIDHRLSELEATNNTEGINGLKQVKRDRLRFLNRTKRRGHYTHYTDGLRMITNLSKLVGLEELPAVLSSVDIGACIRIIKGSPEYEKILNDPKLLPGLSPNAYKS